MLNRIIKIFIISAILLPLYAGVSWSEEPAAKIIKLHFAPVKQITALLNEIKGPEGKVVPNEEAQSVVLIDTPERVKTMETLIAQMDVQTVTEEIPLKFSRASDVLDMVRPLLSQSVGVIKADAEANKITVTDTPSVVERVRKAVEVIDPRGRKLVVEAKLVHLVLDDEHLDGVDWTGIVSDYQNLRLGGRYDFLGGKDKGEALSLGTIEAQDFVPLIEALGTVGYVREFPVSDVPVMSDSEVRMVVRFDEPAILLEKVNPENKENLAAEKAAIDFLLKPQADVDGTIKIVIAEQEPLVSGQNIVQGKGAGASALLGRRPRSVSVRCSDGGSFVLGGLIATEQVLTQRKIPIMGDLPLLGFAFQYHNSSIRREEFVVIVTPRIVTTGPAQMTEADAADAVPVK